MQVPRPLGLNGQRRIGLLRAHRGDQPVVEHPGGVHHSGQRALIRDTCKQGAQRLPVGHVTRHDLNLGTPRFQCTQTQPGQVRSQLRHTGRTRPTARCQDQVPLPVRRDQVAGH